MLPPGPGTPASDVAQQQRERLFGAMVASVATRGYAATRVTDLINLSGVSRRSFYDLFPDKEACFLAVVRELVRTLMSLTEEIPGEGDERARRRFRALADMVVAQPAAARLFLIEAYAAGEEAIKPLEEALVILEQRIQAGAAESPKRAGMPPEMIGALVGSALEVVRTRLREGREDELADLGSSLIEFLLSYEAPPNPLRLASRPPAPAPETISGHDHSERALRAFAVVVAERGYANTTIDQVVKRASMSPTTFYANFDGKEDALRAAIDSAGAQIAAAVLPAFGRQPDWPAAVRAAFGALLNFLASRPALAHLVMVDVYAAGPEAVDQREAALRPLTAILEEARQRSPQVPAIATEAILGGVYSMARRQIRANGPESLPALAPLCAYLALAPFIGAEQACEAANGDGRNRPAAGILEGPIRDATRIYQPRLPLIETAEREAAEVPELEKDSAHIGHIVLDEITRSARAGLFDRRPDRILAHLPARVDEQGWRELSRIHDEALEASTEAVARAQERLRDSGEEGIEARSVQTLFEVPKRKP